MVEGRELMSTAHTSSPATTPPPKNTKQSVKSEPVSLMRHPPLSSPATC